MISFATYLAAQNFSGGMFQKLADFLSTRPDAPRRGSDWKLFYWIKENYPDTDLLATAFKCFELTQNILAHDSIERPSDLVVSDLPDYLARKFPAREVLLQLHENQTPILTSQSLAQIFAWRGTGKTMLAGGLAVSLASGSELLAWKSTRPVRVLYVDGEMPDEQIQLRPRGLKANRVVASDFLRLITVGTQEGGIPSLATASGQQALENALGDAEVLILDSVSTLAWMGTNDEENWLLFLGWLNRLRIQKKLCIVILHHAGKSGMQRGHSRSEDMLDLSLKLSRDPDDETEWCKFQMTYDKVRGDRTGIRNLEVEYRNGQWTYKTLEADRLAILKKYRDENPTVVSIRKITKALGAELGIKSSHTMAKLVEKLDAQQQKLTPSGGDEGA